MPAVLKVPSWFQRFLPPGFQFKAVLIGGLLLVLPEFAAAAPPPDFDGRVQAIMQQQGVPGAAVAIVEDGHVSLARGYGMKGLEHRQPVGADTLFQIGSASKAFTAAALAIEFLQTPGMKGPLEHRAYDTFIVRWPDPMIEPAYVTFALDAQGKPERISMKAVSPVADFSFDYHDLSFTPSPSSNP